jgi:hypothetical protein
MGFLSSMKPKSNLGWIELSFFTVVPWISDALTSFSLFTSLYGSLLWGLIFSMALLRFRLNNQEMKNFIRLPLFFVCGLWVSYWLMNLPGRSDIVEGQNFLNIFLVWTHAGLLSSSVGVSFVYLAVLILFLRKDSEIRAQSWDRRNTRWTLPSYENLLDLSKSLISIAVGTWVLGFFLALIKVSRSHPSTSTLELLAMFAHPLWVALFLSLVLLLAAMVWRFSFFSIQRHRGLTSLFLVGLFLLTITSYFFTGLGFKNHTPFEFFLR